ncbi:hypothetical protein DPMN_064932 [Dreissena polymorpha]|uniref:Uncharacterized protein n=1 Tax=Dreissena polymorpha TaxID=45954 RepID=A0A9D4HLK3_DREPO|nr:hypothetical protein DPMN_064932 [Dreissena polymorpha]
MVSLLFPQLADTYLRHFLPTVLPRIPVTQIATIIATNTAVPTTDPVRAAIGKTERRNPAGSVGIPLPPQYTTTQPDGDKSFLIYDNASTDARVLVIDNALAEAEVYRYEHGEPGPFFIRRRCNAYVRR